MSTYSKESNERVELILLRILEKAVRKTVNVNSDTAEGAALASLDSLRAEIAQQAAEQLASRREF